MQQVTPEVGENTQSRVPPRRVSHIARGAIAVEKLHLVNSPEPAGRQFALEPDNMRLETVIVSSVTNDLISFSQSFQLLKAMSGVAEQRFFHQHVFFVGEQVGQNLRLGIVRRANEGRLV